jgi:hypothetical protein
VTSTVAYSCGRRTLSPTMFSPKSWAGVEAMLSGR